MATQEAAPSCHDIVKELMTWALFLASSRIVVVLE